MPVEVSTWGRWNLENGSLVIATPSGYLYSVSVADAKNVQLHKVILNQLSTKNFISVQDILDYRNAVRFLRGS